MMLTPGFPAKSLSRRTRSLAMLSVAVVLVHGAVLHGAPRFPGIVAASAGVDGRPFSTRTIAAPEPLAPLTDADQQSNAAAPGAAAPLRRLPPPPDTEQKVTLAPVQLAQAATESIANLGETETSAVQLASADVALTSAESGPSPNSVTAPAAASQGPVSASATPPKRMAVPGPLRLKYGLKGEIKGIPYSASGELLWLPDGRNYEARLEISVFLLGSKVQTSKGEITAQGLAPTRFGDKYRSEVAAHFERSKGKVSFSANTPDVPLQPGAQDQVSVFMQLASMVGADPDQFVPGTKISFQAVGPRYSEQWAFVVGATEMLDLPGGKVKAMRLTREPTAEFDTRGDVWLAPEMDYLPMRIRLTQANGDFLDLLWKSTEKP